MRITPLGSCSRRRSTSPSQLVRGQSPAGSHQENPRWNKLNCCVLLSQLWNDSVSPTPSSGRSPAAFGANRASRATSTSSSRFRPIRLRLFVLNFPTRVLRQSFCGGRRGAVPRPIQRHPSTTGNKIDFMISGPTGWSAAQLSRDARELISIPRRTPCRRARRRNPRQADLLSRRRLRKAPARHCGNPRVSGEIVDRQYIARFANQLGVADAWESTQSTADAV